jgi:O-methyltransferase
MTGRTARRLITGVFDRLGYTVVRKTPSHPDMEEGFVDVYERCKDYTMTSMERMYAMYKATEYVVRHKIAGDIVECGVWKGGSIMVSAFTLLKMNETKRRMYLYDTYEGMSGSTDKDVSWGNEPASEESRRLAEEDSGGWAYAPLEEVKQNLFSTGYPSEKLVFVKGKVEDTIPDTVPDTISILRLDTDWYESTYHELCHLFPRLSVNGVIIVDDYGHWRGCREATDKYFTENNIKILLHRIDYTGRIGIKT